MNAANHALCNRSRSSRDESVGEEDEPSNAAVAVAQAEPLTVSVRGSGAQDELERMAQESKSGLPQIKVSQAEETRNAYVGMSSADSGESDSDGSSTPKPATARLNSITANRMRRRLKFFFMNPVEKWHARRRFPWKLMLQIIKIVVITAQLCLFAQQRYNHVNYLWDTKISFSHLFIQGWDTSREVQVYPPADGPLAVYKKSDFFDYLDYAIRTFLTGRVSCILACQSGADVEPEEFVSDRLIHGNIHYLKPGVKVDGDGVGGDDDDDFSRIREEAIGSYVYDYENGTVVPPVLCISQYASGHAFVKNNSYILNDNITTNCIDIPPSEANATDWNVKDFLEEKNVTFDFDLLLNTDFTFNLRTIKLRVNLPFDTPECYHLTGKVIFNNHDHDGQILVELDVAARVLECDGAIHLASESSTIKIWRATMNILSIVVCISSLIMCVRALYRGNLLMQATAEFFVRYVGRPLTIDERWEFVNMWYVLICVNDLLIIVGSFLKVGLESKSYEGFLDTWNVCSLFLGVGNMLVWFGLLRYLGFFKTYNVLILTVKKCIPNVLRFSICILMVFAGYSLCGWLVLGPYHLKFRSFSSTMECLYSLINGDDMFATFSSTSGKDPVVWWFSRIYLYTFISLFIYVILSLFIAIIMDAYETIKKYYRKGFPTSDLMKFINECTEEPSSGIFNDDGEQTIHDFINSICCCGRNRQSNGEYERIM